MILTINVSGKMSFALSHLLRKNPSRSQSFEMTFGKAHVFYPVNTEESCTCVLLLDVDPVGLVRKKQGSDFALEQYVNDRPYVASSFMSVAISKVFGSALAGKCTSHPELTEEALNLRVTLCALPSRGGESFLRSLFEPLGYKIDAERMVLDEKFPQWGESPYFTLTLSHQLKLYELLTHLYVLIPVLDNSKHYWVGNDEVEKLLRHGEGWLDTHPSKDTIALRYLKHRRNLAREALSRLTVQEGVLEDEMDSEDSREEDLEARMSLHEQRLEAVLNVIKESGSKTVLDLGCGEGKFLRLLLRSKQFEKIVGMDVSLRSLDIARERLQFDRMRPKDLERIKLLHGSLMYRDKRFAGFESCAVIEVIEHLDEPRLKAFERVLFEFAKPKLVVITTPNREYNVKFENLSAGKFRHKDHRFEWTREEFRLWADSINRRFAYTFELLPLGPEDEGLGAPSQMGVFHI